MENHIEYEIIQNGHKYILSLDIINNKLLINCCDMNPQNNKGFFCEYFHEQLKQFCQAFALTKSVYDDFNLFKKALESKNIRIEPKNNELYITFIFEQGENLPNLMNANLHLEPNSNIINSPQTIEYSPVKYLPTIHVRLPTINIKRPTIYINEEPNDTITKNISNQNIYNSPKKENNNNIINHSNTYIRPIQNNNLFNSPSTPKKISHNEFNYNYNSPLASPPREQISINNKGSPSKNEYFYSSYKNPNNNNINRNYTNNLHVIKRVDSNFSSTSISNTENEEKIRKLQNEFNTLQKEYQNQNIKINELIEKVNELKAENEKLKIENQTLKNKENLAKGIINENTLIKNELTTLNEKYNNELENYKKMKENEISSYKGKIEELKNDNNTLEKELNEYKIEKQKSLLDPNRKKMPNLRIIKGEIIQSNEELEFLTQRICKDHRKITLNLLYKATVDTGMADNFHKRCDDAESTLVLIQSENDKRFGGFTTCSWEGDGEEKKDENAFVFSLDKMKIYDIIQDEKAIGCYHGFGPIFLGCQIRIYDDVFNRGGSTYLKGANYATEEDFELTGGIQEFKVKEIEVYGIIME